MKEALYFIALSFLPILYKLGFWLYIIQLKEYRCDRLKDYLKTPQGKKAVFNFWFFAEIAVFAILLAWIFGKVSYQFAYYSLVFLLQFESLYVFRKIFSWKFFAPKLTKRMVILASLSFLTILFFWGEILFYPQYTFLTIIKLLVFLPVIPLFWNALTSIFFNKAKEKIFKQAEEKMKKLKIKTIAITGSYGKSSTKEFLAQILSSKFNVIKTPKNINTEIGVSQFILNKIKSTPGSNKTPIFIAEAGAYSKGEISRMGKILNHKDGFLTGLGNQHIGLFGGQQKLIESKSEIAEKVLENNGKLYFNISNIAEINEKKIHIKDKAGIIDFEGKTPEIIKKLLQNGKIVYYGKDFEILSVDENGTKFKFQGETFETNIIGLGQIENLQGAILYALNNGVKLEDIKKTIKKLKLPEHTLNISKEVVENPPATIYKIDDSYNLSVNGLINGVETIQFFPGKKLLILDDILELGKDAKQIHYKLGKYLANKIDEILFVGVNYKKEIESGLKDGNFHGKILDKMPYLLEDYVVLFEGRRSGKFLK